MKQSELNRVLNAILKNEAKSRGWRSVGGQPYWQGGHLFFALMVVAVARQRSLHSSLRFKWFSLDDQLWKILGMTSNSLARVSLRADGAFTLIGQELNEEAVQECDLSVEWLQSKCTAIATSAAAKAAEIVSEIRNLDDYLEVIEREHSKLMTRVPPGGRRPVEGAATRRP